MYHLAHNQRKTVACGNALCSRVNAEISAYFQVVALSLGYRSDLPEALGHHMLRRARRATSLGNIVVTTSQFDSLSATAEVGLSGNHFTDGCASALGSSTERIPKPQGPSVEGHLRRSSTNAVSAKVWKKTRAM